MANSYTFRNVARMEWIKLRTLRSVRWTLLFALAGMIGIGIAAGFNTRNPKSDVTNNILVGGALGSVLFAVLGVLRAVVLSGAYLCLVGLIGLAAGVIVRHGAAAITAVVALVFVAPLAGLAATPAGQYLPELIYANALGATKPVQGFTLSPWAGLAIIAAYAVVLLTVGGWLLTRRDA